MKQPQLPLLTLSPSSCRQGRSLLGAPGPHALQVLLDPFGQLNALNYVVMELYSSHHETSAAGPRRVCHHDV